MDRFRDLRKTQEIRDSVAETSLTKKDFIQPFFVVAGTGKRETIESMPGIYRYSTDNLLKSIDEYVQAGGRRGLLFGLPEKKDEKGTEAFRDDGVVQEALKEIKKHFPDFELITDVCLCAYMSHGHCGIIEDEDVNNDLTLPVLAQTALSHARAGADMVAPSDMMDFRVEAIRKTLDQEGFKNTKIMSYAAKYHSSFYGPFREAADSIPQFGDRRTYQMDYRNQKEALKEAEQDIKEGADIVMVKPALAYLDVVALIKNNVRVPVAAYCVSGEYSLIKAAAEKGWINEKDIVIESMTAVKRAGADLIITYYAADLLKWLS